MDNVPQTSVPSNATGLPSLSTAVRQALVNNVWQQLLFQNPHRRFYLIQNLSTVEYLLIATQEDADQHQLLPPTGAKLIDCPSETTLYAMNPNNANIIPVAIEEIMGYTPWEQAMLQTQIGILQTLQKILMGGS